MKTRGTLCRVSDLALIVCGSGVSFEAHPYAWMKAGNLLASLAPLPRIPRVGLFQLSRLPPSTLTDDHSVFFGGGFFCIYLQPALFGVCISERYAMT